MVGKNFKFNLFQRIKMKKIAIIGAGASGLIASIMASKKSTSVVVFEKNSKIGKKILATGNGRCNITNRDIDISNFYGLNPNFAKTALNEFDFKKCEEFFNAIGIEFKEGERGRLYPMSLQSSSVVDLLVYEAKRVGVEFRLSSEVKKISSRENGFLIKTESKSEYFSKILIASGGLASPSLGSSDSGYEFAKAYSHTIVEPFASLVQLISNAPFLKRISGVKVNASVKVLIDKREIDSTSGDLLFTNYGLSGSAILDISRAVSLGLKQRKSIEIVLDLLPEFSKDRLLSLFQKRVKFANDKSVEFWLEGLVNKKLTPIITKEASLRGNIKSAKELNRKDLLKIIYAIKSMRFNIIDTKGFKTAEVTAGGVDTEDINPQTMESKLKRGLYFSGEVVDIDGDCGGYNLQWAWASGFIAGREMSR